jgi:hypothetical protein
VNQDTSSSAVLIKDATAEYSDWQKQDREIV